MHAFDQPTFLCNGETSKNYRKGEQNKLLLWRKHAILANGFFG
jgi:hypothetical protein